MSQESEQTEAQARRRQLELWKALCKSKGYLAHTELGEEMIAGIMAKLLTPARGLDGLIEKEGLLGKIAGITEFCKLPEIQIEMLNAQIKSEQELSEVEE